MEPTFFGEEVVNLGEGVVTVGEVSNGLLPLVSGASLFQNVINTAVYPFVSFKFANTNYSEVINYFADLGFAPKEQLSVI